jgi:flavin reductase (DIM6/NTAB) family NADH-FMN oxidoreductase RutF
VTPDAFDELIQSLDEAMVIVTTVHGGERSGCLVGFHSQCSIEPLRYALWLSKANHTYGVARHATHFGVHLLPAADHDLAQLFGSETGDEVDKFAACEWTEGPGGVPLLSALADRFVLRRVSWSEDDGDHACMVGEPVAAQSSAHLEALRLSDAGDIRPGHPAGDSGTG